MPLPLHCPKVGALCVDINNGWDRNPRGCFSNTAERVVLLASINARLNLGKKPGEMPAW